MTVWGKNTGEFVESVASSNITTQTLDVLFGASTSHGLDDLADSAEPALLLTPETRCVPEESPSAGTTTLALTRMGFSCFVCGFCWLEFVHAMQPIGLCSSFFLAFLHFFTFVLENAVIGSVSPHTLQVICTGGPPSFGSCGFGGCVLVDRLGQEYW